MGCPIQFCHEFFLPELVIWGERGNSGQTERWPLPTVVERETSGQARLFAFVNWPIPALARAKGTWLGAWYLSHFLPPPTRIDQDCNVHREFPKVLQKPMEDLVDAFLYLGPQDLRLREKIPADIAFGRQLQNGIAARRSPVGISRRSF
jgi:hypothetical protein